MTGTMDFVLYTYSVNIYTSRNKWVKGEKDSEYILNFRKSSGRKTM